MQYDMPRRLFYVSYDFNCSIVDQNEWINHLSHVSRANDENWTQVDISISTQLILDLAMADLLKNFTSSQSTKRLNITTNMRYMIKVVRFVNLMPVS